MKKHWSQLIMQSNLIPQMFFFYNQRTVIDKLNRYEEALQAFDQAILLDPSMPQSYDNKGVLLDNLKRYDQAIEMFNNCIKIDPQYQHAYYNRGISLMQIKKFIEAIAMFDEIIKLNPQNIQALNQKGSYNYVKKRSALSNQEDNKKENKHKLNYTNETHMLEIGQTINFQIDEEIKLQKQFENFLFSSKFIYNNSIAQIFIKLHHQFIYIETQIDNCKTYEYDINFLIKQPFYDFVIQFLNL